MMVRSSFYQAPFQRIFFKIYTKTFNLELNHISGLKLTESCGAGGK